MRTALTIIATLLFSAQSYSQWQLASVPPSRSVEVAYPAANAAYITADLGQLFKSIDGGDTWSEIYDFGPFANLANPSFVNADTGFVDVLSSVYRTFDGGNSWMPISNTWPQPSFVPYFRYKLTGQTLYASYTSNDTAYIIKSNDYGNTVTKIFSHYEPNAQPFVFSFLDTLNGFLINPNELQQELRTTDGAQTFDTVFITTGPIVLQSKFDFTDLQNGYHYGSYGSQSHPTRTWNTGSFYFPIDLDGFGVLPVLDLDFNTSKLYAASLYGKIFYSTNDGQNWTEQSTPISDPIYSIAFLNENEGIAVADGKVLNTSNGGNIGIDEPIEPLDGIEVFPNPATDYMVIKSPNDLEIVKVALSDITGREVRSFNPVSSILSLTSVNAGTYLLKVTSSSNVTVFPITVQ